MAKGKQPMMLPIYEDHSDIWCLNYMSFKEPVLEHIPIDTNPEKYELIKKGSKRGKILWFLTMVLVLRSKKNAPHGAAPSDPRNVPAWQGFGTRMENGGC